MSLKPPFLSYKKIGVIADQFLSKYYPTLTLPIPIEEIAESKLGLIITQEMNLKKDFDVDGFLTSDLTIIFIDFDLYLKHENRTRLIIAHEVGHLILHGDLFRELNINSTEDLNKLIEKVTDEDYRWLEYQAYSFAGQVLVPQQLLVKELKNRLGKLPTSETPEVILPILQDLLDVFQVSGEVLLRRLQREGIVKTNS